MREKLVLQIVILFKYVTSGTFCQYKGISGFAVKHLKQANWCFICHLDISNYWLPANFIGMLCILKSRLDFLPAPRFMCLWRTLIGECDSVVKTIYINRRKEGSSELVKQKPETNPSIKLVCILWYQRMITVTFNCWQWLGFGY